MCYQIWRHKGLLSRTKYGTYFESKTALKGPTSSCPIISLRVQRSRQSFTMGNAAWTHEQHNKLQFLCKNLPFFHIWVAFICFPETCTCCHHVTSCFLSPPPPPPFNSIGYVVTDGSRTTKTSHLKCVSLYDATWEPSKAAGVIWQRLISAPSKACAGPSPASDNLNVCLEMKRTSRK